MSLRALSLGIVCLVAGHRHDRRRDANHGLDLWSACKVCGRPIVRDEVRQRWRARRQGKAAIGIDGNRN